MANKELTLRWSRTTTVGERTIEEIIEMSDNSDTAVGQPVMLNKDDQPIRYHIYEFVNLVKAIKGQQDE